MPESKIAPLSQECSKDHYTTEEGSFTAGLAFWPRPKIFGQFGRPKWLNGQNSQFSAKFWPNNTHNIVLILIRKGLAIWPWPKIFLASLPGQIGQTANGQPWPNGQMPTLLYR